MMTEDSELSILTKRRRELLARRTEAQAVLVEVDKELALNDATGDYLARLTGAEWPPVGEARPIPTPKSPRVSGEPGLFTTTGHIIPANSAPTQPEMILAVLADAAGEGFEGLSPADMRDRIAARFKVKLPKEGVSPTAWRMWKRGRLKKVREGLYAAPEKNEAADRKSVGDGSEASDLQPTQAGEGRAGGGT